MQGTKCMAGTLLRLKRRLALSVERSQNCDTMTDAASDANEVSQAVEGASCLLRAEWVCLHFFLAHPCNNRKPTVRWCCAVREPALALAGVQGNVQEQARRFLEHSIQQSLGDKR